MRSGIRTYLRKLLKAPHPNWQTKESRNRVTQFLQDKEFRTPDGLKLNVGCGSQRLGVKIFNLDLTSGAGVHIQGDLLNLPIKGESIDAIVCTGVIEHVSEPYSAVKEIYRVLKAGGCAFIEVPFMQTYHVSPKDYYRWTPDGLRQLFKNFKIDQFHVIAGPGTALAWQFQQTMAMLFSFKREVLYKIGLCFFGWMAVPVSWLDVILEKNQMAWRAASGYAFIAAKS